MSKKYIIEASEEQLQLIGNCLEDIGRFASGQTELSSTLNKITGELSTSEEFDKYNRIVEALKNVKRIMYPELGEGGSYSYNATPFIGNIYQIWRTIKYQLNTDRGISDVYSHPALPSGDMGGVKIKLVE